MKASVIFFPNNSKQNQRTGKIPVYMRICFKSKKSESRLNAEVTTDELLKWDSRTMRIAERNSAINHYLNRIDEKFRDFITDNATSLPAYDAAYIKDFVLGNTNISGIRILDYVDKYYAESVMNNVNRKSGTIKNYRKAINHLRKFLIQQKKEGILINQLDYELAMGFKNYLVNSNPNTGRIGMTEVSASGIIKKFRTIFTQAVDQELLNKNHFKTVKIKTKSPQREKLTIFQVKQIKDLDLQFYPYLQLYQRIFLLCVFTGLAYKDIMNLEWTSLEERAEGNVKLTIRREKTDVFTECFLVSFAINIANEYRNSPESRVKNLVVPTRSNKEFNEQLKMLSTLARVPTKLTSHIARHTFRQLLGEAGIENDAVIKRMMGQKRKGDMDEIYYSVTENGLLNAKEKFETFLKKHLL